MQSARESAIGLPNRSTSVSRMLGFVTPPEVRSSFTTASALDRYGLVWHTDRSVAQDSSALLAQLGGQVLTISALHRGHLPRLSLVVPMDENGTRMFGGVVVVMQVDEIGESARDRGALV